MGKNKGWICLHRKIQDCELWDGDEPFDRRSAWIDLLLLANHEDKRTIFDGHPIVIKRGQRLTSIRKLSARWHWSVQRTMNYLKLLEELGMITRDSDKRRTLLTVVNYGIYNDMRNTDENTHENSNKNTDGTLARTLTEHSLDTNNNDNNENNENNDNKKRREKKPPRSRYGEFNHVILSDEEFNKLCDEYGEAATLKAIRKVDEYCERSGKTYKNYYLTLRNWGFTADRNEERKSSVERKMDMLANLDLGGGFDE